jgi:hypothetical protein
VAPAAAWAPALSVAEGDRPYSGSASLFFHASAACNPATNSVSASAIDQNSVAVSAGPATAAVVTTRPQVSVSKTLLSPPSGTAAVGETVTFRIDVTNNGSTTITNLPLTDSYSAPHHRARHLRRRH